jgi:hypothetical protein
MNDAATRRRQPRKSRDVPYHYQYLSPGGPFRIVGEDEADPAKRSPMSTCFGRQAAGSPVPGARRWFSCPTICAGGPLVRGASRGIVSKRLSAPYRTRPSPDWLKVKNPDSPAIVGHREGRWYLCPIPAILP